MLRLLHRVTASLLLVYLAASAAGSYVAVAGSRNPVGVSADRIGAHHENVVFPSRTDHIPLAGWLFHAAAPTGRSIVFVHGWFGNREDVDFAPLARRFLAEGYDVLLFDLRASGQSGGSTQTFAHDEPRDVLGAYDFMRTRGYAPRRMVIAGNSMGAATVIEAAPQLTDVGALICDSAYTSMSAAVATGMHHDTSLPSWLAAPAVQFSRLWGVDPGLRPIDVVASLRTRAFLFIQASGDQLVDPASAAELRAASPDPQSELLVIPGHSHLDTFNADPGLFMATVNRFIATQLGAA